MHVLRIAAIAAAALFAAVAAAETLEPFDEAPRDPALAATRDALIAAVEARDADALLAHTAPDVQLGFGGEAGHAALREALRSDAGLWDELHWVLTHGGGFDGGLFLAPYTFAGDVSDDPFRAGYVTGTDVNLRASPDTNALVIATLSHALVEVEEWNRGAADGDGGGWARIVLPDGRRGHIAKDYLRSPIDYRVLLEKADGGWRIRAIVAGD